MSLIAPTLNSSSSVALKLLTDAATRSADPASARAPVRMGATPDQAAIGAATHASGVRITLTLDAAERAYGADSFLMQTARGRADQVEISTTVIPADKDGFRASVLGFLREDMKADAGFMAALKAGQVTIRTVDEVPEFNFQPFVSFSLYMNGHHQGGGGFSPSGTNHDLYEEMGKTRGQAFGSLGNSQFLAYWPKLV